MLNNVFIALTFFYVSIYAQSFDELKTAIKVKDNQKVLQILSKLQVVYSEHELPANPNLKELVILEDHYGLQTLNVYTKQKQWEEISDPYIAKLLNKNGSMNVIEMLSGIKPEQSTFAPYIQDIQTPVNKPIKVAIKPISFSEKNLQQTLDKLIQELQIKSENIINLQIIQNETKNFKLVIFYRD